MASRIPIPQDRIAAICRQYHVRKLALFGSVLRADFRLDSDVDILVEFEPHHTPGFFGLARIERELTQIIGSSERPQTCRFASVPPRGASKLGATLRLLETQALCPGIPWADIIGMRHRLVHAYFDIDTEVVWQTIASDIPPLTTLPENLLGKSVQSGGTST